MICIFINPFLKIETMKKILTFLLILSGLGVSAQQVVQVADINVGAGDSYPSHLAEFNNEMYFTACSNGVSCEIWKYDGVNAPVMIPDSNTNSALVPVSYKAFNSKLYFSYGYQSIGAAEGFWVYDGVNPPTLVANMNPSGHDFNTQTSIFTEFNGKLYFGADNGITGYELWEYDAVNAPSLVMDINPNADHSSPRAFTIFQNKLYFVASPNNTTSSLMVYDGVLPPALVYGNIHGNSSLVLMNNKLYMNALTNASDPFSATLFEYDGINTPIQVTSNLGVGQSFYLGDVYADFFGKLYIGVVPNSTGIWQNWLYDGVNPASYVGDSIKNIGTTGIMYNNEVYFMGTDTIYDYELWKYDGTNPAVRLSDINTNGRAV